MRLNRRLTTLLVAVLLVTVVAGCSKPAETGKSEDTKPLVIAMSKEAATLDMHQGVGTYTASVLFHLYDALTWRTPEGNVEPKLAESYKALDDTTWEFKLRKDVKFHNGEPFTAEAVKYNVERIQNPEYKSRLAGDFAMIERVDVIDENTVHIVTKRPYPGLPLRLTYLGMVPPKYTAEVGDAEFAEKPVGTGPYKFVEWVHGEKIVLEANEDYFLGAPKIKQVIFKTIPEDGTRMVALETGEADIITQVPPSELKRLESKEGLSVVSGPTTRAIFVGLDTLKGGPLAKKEVRQALNYAVNREQIVDTILQGLGKPVANLVLPQFDGYAEDIAPYPYDPEKAKELLAAAGYPDGFSTSLAVVPGSVEGVKEVAEAIAADLGQVGVKVEVKTMEAARQLQLELEHKTDPMFMSGLGGPYADAELLIRISTGTGQRYSNYSNPELDALVEKAASCMDDAQRDELWREVQLKLMDEAPLLYLYQRYAGYGVRDRVKGWQPRLDELVLSYGASLE
ncbi:MAG: ABC transporter substrate-binding protein [Firmicutes bacterium]|nr:ABC transporter substrate-binding protein [Bacillota bacterium]